MLDAHDFQCAKGLKKLLDSGDFTMNRTSAPVFLAICKWADSLESKLKQADREFKDLKQELDSLKAKPKRKTSRKKKAASV